MTEWTSGRCYRDYALVPSSRILTSFYRLTGLSEGGGRTSQLILESLVRRCLSPGCTFFDDARVRSTHTRGTAPTRPAREHTLP
jgi:hypothetical protein